MICPSGELSGSDIFSTSNATMRLTATSSGASTSRTLLPETSKTRTFVVATVLTFPLQRPAAVRHQSRHCRAVLGVVLFGRDLERLAADLKAEHGVGPAKDGGDLAVREGVRGAAANDDAPLVVLDVVVADLQPALRHVDLRVDAQSHVSASS